MGSTFKKSYLDLKDKTGICLQTGYDYILEDMKQQIHSSGKQQTIALDSYLKAPKEGECLELVYKKTRFKRTAQWFIRHVANHDGNYKDISSFDLEYAQYHLYGKQWKEDWVENFFSSFKQGRIERIREYGTILNNPYSSKKVKKLAKTLLTALQTELENNGSAKAKDIYLPTIKYFLNPVEPIPFKSYLQTTLMDFSKYTKAQKEKLFDKAVKGYFPTEAILKELLPMLSYEEATLFRRSLFKEDVLKAMELFEQKAIYRLNLHSGDRNAVSNESEFFPNLSFNTPFKDRKKTIEKFLGNPVYFRHANYVRDGKTQGWTTIKKYRWVGDTEVFTLDSGKPGPVTLVFSPHFHENNPRRYFHWLKDLPLTSGMIIFIPEANRAMGRAGLPTNPMNRIFNRALTRDRMDYLVVRRVEYLMGLVDGVIGIHDAYQGPFYISDMLAKPTGISTSLQGPNYSRWIPKGVLKINKFSPDMTSFGNSVYHARIPPPQIQWKIAECSRRLLEKWTGTNYRYSPEDIRHQGSASVHTTTGYVNYILGKPAMTFEGKKGSEHGQLHAMAITSLLLAFGHKMDPVYKKVIKDPKPKEEPKLYKGLPPVSPPKPKKIIDLFPEEIFRLKPSPFQRQRLIPPVP